MKVMKQNLGLGLIAAIVAVSAFYATRAVGESFQPPSSDQKTHLDQRDEHPARWLQMEPEEFEQIRQTDPSFRQDMRQLGRQLQIERLELANLVEADESTEQELQDQFDKAGQAHLAIHERVARHVLAIRPHLNSEQRGRFFGLLARRLRGDMESGMGSGDTHRGTRQGKFGRPSHGGPHQGPRHGPPRERGGPPSRR